MAVAIKPIYTAASAERAEAELSAYQTGPWGERFPTVAAPESRPTNTKAQSAARESVRGSSTATLTRQMRLGPFSQVDRQYHRARSGECLSSRESRSR